MSQNIIFSVYNIGVDKMTKRKIYAKRLIADLDFYHLAKEFYMYIFRYPELEQDNEWAKIKELAEDIMVESRCRKDYLQEIDPVWYREFLQFYTGLEVKNYDEEREFIFTETDKEIFIYLCRKPKLKNPHKRSRKKKTNMV